MKNRLVLAGALGLATLVVALLLLRQTALLASIPGLAQVESAAEARRDGQDTPVLRVAGRPVTVADLDEMEHWTVANLDWMRDALTNTTDEGQRALLERHIALIEAYGAPTVALAALIRDRALEAAAEREGLWPDEATVRARVERDRALAATSGDARLAAYIRTFGEQAYWNDWYPRVAAREIALERLYEAHTGHLSDLQQRQALWLETERSIVQEAGIEVVEDERLPASVDSALRYLDEYWKLTEDSLSS